ncbi:hypothetical protein AVEN_124312-1 [Araneus ventricosus]|uniref:Uncharacterized protein n=1 Tax=Araneus ventricosus TaxID=182803 RepID=A0A4Y2RSW4_ARAVE|nr:hypothetical protein AVEN_109772-1 [Araneus ventricosus]GBN78838.1 hypothetical protein AVEN_124312-1 [Araneus ventricosus]
MCERSSSCVALENIPNQSVAEREGRWFTSNEDQRPVPSVSQQGLPEQRVPTICHSQGDVPGPNPKSSRDTEHIGVGNLDPSESHLQGDESDRINSNMIGETDDVDVEGLDGTMTRVTEMHNLPRTQDETNTPQTESISESGRHIFFDVPHTSPKKTSQQASNLSTNSNLMTLTTRSGRVYYKNRN